MSNSRRRGCNVSLSPNRIGGMNFRTMIAAVALCKSIPRAILISIAAVGAGCGTESGSEQSHRDRAAQSARQTLTETPLRVVAVANSARRKNQTEYTVTLLNDSESDCRIDSIRLTTAGKAAASDRIARISSNFVPAGAYAFAVARIHDSNQATDHESSIEFDVDGHTGQSPVNLEPTAVSAHRLKLSADLSAARMYLRLPSDQAFRLQDVATLRVNGRDAQQFDVSVLPERDSAVLIGVTFDLSPRPVEGEVVFVDLTLNDGTRYVSSSKAFHCWFIGRTQYDSPLRVVTVVERNDSLQMELYNESDFAKAPIAIDSIRLGNEDVTADCEIPADPLPPDRHNYRSDARFLTLTRPWRNGKTQLVEIDFHRIGTQKVSAAKERSQRETIGCYVRRGCDTAIGYAFDPYLPGCISLHNGGLRPHLGARDVEARMHAIATQSKSVPVYANVSTGVDASEAADIGAACDVVVVSPKTSIKPAGKDAVAETVAYYAELRDRGVPFVTSVSTDFDAPFSPNDYRWSTMLALCEGSCGCLLRSTADQDTDLARSCLPVVESIKRQWQSLAQSLSLSESYRISATSNQPGIHVGSRSCGPDELVVFAINEWCTRAAYQGSESFYAVPRHGVELGLRLDHDWNVAAAEDAFERTPIPVRHGDDGITRLTLSEFDIGHCIRLRRSTDVTTNGPTGGQAVGEGHPPQVMPTVTPLKSPFFSFGRQETGTEHMIRIPIRNSTAAEVAINVKAISRRVSNPGMASFAATTIPASTDGTLIGMIVVPATVRSSVTHLRISTSNDIEDGFDCFIHIEPYSPITCDPEIVDFREFTSVQDQGFQSLKIRSESLDFRIENADSPDLPAEILIAADAKSLRFRAKPDSFGGFTGKIRMQVSVTGPGSVVRRIPINIPFTGHYVRDVAAEPERLLLVTTGRRLIRRIKIRRFDGKPVSIVQVRGNASWVRPRCWTADAAAEPTVDIVVLPSEPASRSATVEIDIATENHQTRRIGVPIKIIGSPPPSLGELRAAVANQGAIPKFAPAGSDSRAASGSPTFADVSRRVHAILHAARVNKTLPQTPNWAGMHQLLTLGENAYSEGSVETQSVIDCVINPDSPRPPFVIRNGKPIERRRGEGELFDHQHHRDQFLHLMSMCGVPRNATLFVNDRQFRVADLLDSSLLESQTNGELAWSVSAYSVYLQPGFQWANKHGTKLTLGALVDRLLGEVDGACGGTHQLLGLARVFSNRAWKEDPSLRTLWPRLEDKLLREVQRAKEQQANNGSFDPPANLRKQLLAQPDATESRLTVYYTGHCMEWLATFLSTEQLREPWMLQAADALADALVADYADESALRDARTTEEFYRYGNQTHALSGLSRWSSKSAR